MNTEADVSERNGFSQSALIRSGWTQTMIVQLLGEPDRTVENPYYVTGLPMRLYDADRVRAVEATEAFRVLQSVLRRKDRKPAAEPMTGSLWEQSSQIARLLGTWTRWHIVKSTDKLVFVYDRPDVADRWTHKLPRLPLERDGQVDMPGYWGRTFYTDAGKLRFEQEPRASSPTAPTAPFVDELPF